MSQSHVYAKLRCSKNVARDVERERENAAIHDREQAQGGQRVHCILLAVAGISPYSRGYCQEYGHTDQEDGLDRERWCGPCASTVHVGVTKDSLTDPVDMAILSMCGGWHGMRDPECHAGCFQYLTCSFAQSTCRDGNAYTGQNIPPRVESDMQADVVR